MILKRLKAEIEKNFLNGDEPIIANLWLEYYRTLSANIPLDRLQQICDAERDGRLHIAPCKVGGEIWYIVPLDGKLIIDTETVGDVN